MDKRDYGIYIIKDSFSIGRVTGFMPQPNDLAAMYQFKKFLENEENLKNFPILRKLELIRCCRVDQLTDRLLTEELNKTVCNATNVEEYIKIYQSRMEAEEV